MMKRATLALTLALCATATRAETVVVTADRMVDVLAGRAVADQTVHGGHETRPIPRLDG